MGNSEYAMSFSTGGLFRRESLEAASLFLQSGSWDAVRKEIMAKNLLQARTLSTLQRECREVLSRLRLLNGEELRFLVEAEYREQGHLLWIAVCRRYPFVRDFAVEVLRERYITLKADVRYEEFDAFFNAQSEAPATDMYGGGTLLIHGRFPDIAARTLVPAAPGTLVAFRSETTHEVTPVTHGERYSIVSWYR